MLNNELPRFLKDVPYMHAYEGKKIWTLLGDNKRLIGSLVLAEDSASLDFEVSRAEADKYKNRIQKVTAVDKYSRIVLLNSSVWESPLTGFLKTGPARMRLSPNIVVIQGSSNPYEEKVQKLTGYLPGIGEWFKEDFLDFDHNEYRFKQTKTIYHEIPFGGFAKVILNAKLTIDNDSLFIDKKFIAYQESFVQIEFDKPTSIAGALNIFNYVENFFNFIFSTPHATHIFTSGAMRRRRVSNGLTYIFCPYRRKEYRREDLRNENSMLFAFGDVSNINDVFVHWVLQYDRIHEIAEALVLLKSTKVSEELRFTTIINALESVHRRYYDHKLQTDEAYRNRMETIVGQIVDNNDKLLVRNRLQHGNEISLRNRLKEVYSIGLTHGIQVPEKKLTDKIIATRNYFTHGNESGKQGTLSMTELFGANSLLGGYLKLTLLQILGVADAELREIVKESVQLRTYYRDEPPTKNAYYF